MLKLENMGNTVNCWMEAHPIGFLILCSIGGFAALMPLCAFYKWILKSVGDVSDKTLTDSGVLLGYNHD